MGYLLKISGAGNRFILVDKRWFKQSNPSQSNQKELEYLKSWGKHSQHTKLDFEDFTALSHSDLATKQQFLNRLLSHPQFTLTDGLVVLKETSNTLVCDFYNKDGSKAEMCGNATCCLSFYLDSLNSNIKTFYLENTKVNLDSKGAILLDKPKKDPLHFTNPFPFYFIDTGVPHGVIPCDEIHFPSDKASSKTIQNLKKKAQALRFKNIKTYKEGMNVSFYQVLSDYHLKAITFERGVEDFTLACGTGALAVSLVHSYKKNLHSPLKIKMPGGDLTVEIADQLKLKTQVKKGF